MKVSEILRKKSLEVVTIQPHQSLLDASKALVEHNIGALVVVDDSRNPVGILSERDIVRHVARNGKVTGQVGDVMTHDLIIALPDDEITYLSNTMTSKRIRHLPVMDEDKLVGIVSIGDVVKAQLDHYEGEAHTLRHYISGGYA